MDPRRLCLTLVLPLALLAGCGGDPEPKLAPPSSSPSVSVSDVVASPSSVPEAWEVQSEDGAIAFVEHWITVFNSAGQDGVTRDLRAASTQGCEVCNRFIRQIRDVYDGGGSIRTDGWQVVSSAPSQGLPADKAQIAVRVRQTPQVVVDRGGEKTSYPANDLTITAVLVWQGNAWLMQSLETLA